MTTTTTKTAFPFAAELRERYCAAGFAFCQATGVPADVFTATVLGNLDQAWEEHCADPRFAGMELTDDWRALCSVHIAEQMAEDAAHAARFDY